MTIQNTSPANSLQNVPAEAAMRVTGMAISNQKQQIQDLMKLLNSTQFITDPAMGNRINYLA
jgi:hypothetical protein